MENYKKEMLKTCGFGKQVENADKGICVFCEIPIKMVDFRDSLSLKEFNISGICQKCQDKIFK